MIKSLYFAFCVLGLSLSAHAMVGTDDLASDTFGSDASAVDLYEVRTPEAWTLTSSPGSPGHSWNNSMMVSLNNGYSVDTSAPLQLASRYHGPRERKYQARRVRHSHGGALGYFVGGLIIGNILSESHSHNTHSHSRYDQSTSSRYDSTPDNLAPVYWLDKRGDCFRLESRSHGEVYVQVSDQECY